MTNIYLDRPLLAPLLLLSILGNKLSAFVCACNWPLFSPLVRCSVFVIDTWHGTRILQVAVVGDEAAATSRHKFTLTAPTVTLFMILILVIKLTSLSLFDPSRFGGVIFVVGVV